MSKKDKKNSGEESAAGFVPEDPYDLLDGTYNRNELALLYHLIKSKLDSGLKDIEGNLLTLIDALFVDKEQREAFKSNFRKIFNKFWENHYRIKMLIELYAELKGMPVKKGKLFRSPEFQEWIEYYEEKLKKVINKK